MKLDDLKQAWQEEVKILDNKPEISSAVKALESETKKLDREIRFRDIVESVVAIIIIPFMVYDLFHYQNLIETIGVFILMSVCLLISFKLRAARKVTSKLTNIHDFLTLEKQKIEAQVKLLESFTYWYVAPIFLSVVLIKVGRNINKTGEWVIDGFATWYLPFVAVFFGLLWYLNKRMIKDKFKPMQEKIEQQLLDLDRH